MEQSKKYEKLIENQIEKNIFVNIFSGVEQLTFDKELVEYIKTMVLDKIEENKLIKHCASTLLLKLYKYNQYINISKLSFLALQKIYEKLILEIRQNQRIDIIEKNHYKKIKQFLLETNPFLGQINQNGIKSFANEEYSYKFQLELFGLDIQSIKGPVLDIGCGKKYNLVTYLNESNIEAYGIDRFENNSPYVINDDFISYNYKENYWSTIISNMAFSNHFNKHLFFKDDKIKDFSVAYFTILKSLNVGGRFFYAPSIIEIEKFIDKNCYEVSHKEVAYGLYTTCVRRIQ